MAHRDRSRRPTCVRLGLVLFAACGNQVAPVETTRPHGECSDEHPRGSATDYVPPELAGFTIAPPVSCDEGAYVRITRASGARRLGIAGGGGKGFTEGCTTRPASASDCPVLNWSVPLAAAEEDLRNHGIELIGLGGGPCANTQGDFAAWNMSIDVRAWGDVAPALRLVAEEMDRYDVAGYLGVGVRGLRCVVPG